MIVRFWVPGVAAPGGSKTAFRNQHTGKVHLVDAGKNNRGWKRRVAVFASGVMNGKPPLQGPIRLTMTFWMPRPRSHYGTGKNIGILKDTAPYFHTSKPDVTKLLRAAEDACKGILWPDDSCVSQQCVDKVYADGRGPGVTIEVETLGG